jgi:hypothetical protein
VTILITALIARRRSTEKLLDALNANAGVTGFGLLITAIIQTFQKRLDLYHAIFVLHVVYFLGLFAYFSGALVRYHRFSSANSCCHVIRDIQMDPHAHPTWGNKSDHGDCSVPCLVNIYLGTCKYIWIDPRVQRKNQIRLTFLSRQSHCFVVEEILDHWPGYLGGLDGDRYYCRLFRHPVGTSGGYR